MSRKNYIERYRLIIERIRIAPCRFDQIREYLLRSNEFMRMGILDYSIRTLQRDIQCIEEEYDLVIKNKMGVDARYYISE
ncbi:hypothetical protein HZP66_04330 [Elizabethkingia anophelis]|uniref:hypothetical protein n=1 Tax=Elizabethkingia anophelis TaxID=1117645 RepID=UPI003891824B|nr:hypothetical protein [Elizabethkingia anophelis]